MSFRDCSTVLRRLTMVSMTHSNPSGLLSTIPNSSDIATQSERTQFTKMKWIGLYRIQKVLSDNNYLIRKINTNKTQCVHRIRLRKYVPHETVPDIHQSHDIFPDPDAKPDSEIYAQMAEAEEYMPQPQSQNPEETEVIFTHETYRHNNSSQAARAQKIKTPKCSRTEDIHNDINTTGSHEPTAMATPDTNQASDNTNTETAPDTEHTATTTADTCQAPSNGYTEPETNTNSQWQQQAITETDRQPSDEMIQTPDEIERVRLFDLLPNDNPTDFQSVETATTAAEDSDEDYATPDETQQTDDTSGDDTEVDDSPPKLMPRRNRTQRTFYQANTAHVTDFIRATGQNTKRRHGFNALVSYTQNSQKEVQLSNN